MAEIVAQQEQHRSASVPSHDHDSEIDFARLFARTIGDKERLRSENAMLLEEHSRLKTGVEELEVASMLQIQVSRLLGMGEYRISMRCLETCGSGFPARRRSQQALHPHVDA